jgi:hypothetical protein
MKFKHFFSFAVLIGAALIFTAFSLKNASSAKPAKSESFAGFLSHFPKVSLPYSIGLGDFEGYKVYQNGKGQHVAQAIATRPASPISRSKFIPGSEHFTMSRMGPPELQPVARFYPNEKMVAVIYSSSLPFGGDLNKSFHLVVYDLKGNVVSVKSEKPHKIREFQLAYSSLENTVTCTLDAQGHIWQNSYENVWKYNPEEKGYADNKLMDFKLKNTLVCQLGNDGKISEMKHYPTTSKASLN